MSRKLVSFDWAMKKILRQKANFGILEGFLTELLKFDVKIQEILESEANQETEDDKFNRVDLLTKNESGELILIEVQHSSQIDYFNRMLYGSSKLITEYIKKGDGYVEVKKVYSVNIVYFELGQGRDYIYHGRTEFRGFHDNEEILDPSQNQKNKFLIDRVYEIYPEYFVIRVDKFNDIAKNSLDEWIYFLKNEEIKDKFKAKGLDEAKETLNVMKLGDRARAVYERREQNRMYKASLLYTAKVEGEEIGEKRGKKEGREEGKKEEKIEIAKTSLKQNIDIDTIALITGLSVEEIEKLKEDG
ncbi:Rpn family recombination-promoting nuclease/putative transposase [Sulfurovum sp. bin170]|uniref:Rpn family recombination-promoting nuclease/putative transposase n=1 Tax=Sulfurovum sp. bin170 TaxID=2695268 RepID=UPI0013DF1B35|nr:Rpn family recombination-promoting nuclease/putative transposase [Sulfurovum sp. bin170]NEW61322.1 Rpn family recombination-promoting nuclease/putative transposase [Sulfurovum sp. bin170]